MTEFSDKFKAGKLTLEDLDYFSFDRDVKKSNLFSKTFRDGTVIKILREGAGWFNDGKEIKTVGDLINLMYF